MSTDNVLFRSKLWEYVLNACLMTFTINFMICYALMREWPETHKQLERLSVLQGIQRGRPCLLSLTLALRLRRIINDRQDNFCINCFVQIVLCLE